MKFNLSEITQLIRTRRMVPPERYTSRVVHREQLELAVNNATWAPTHGLTQPWFFHVFHENGMRILQEELPAIYKVTTPEEKFSESKFQKLSERTAKVSAAVIVSMRRDSAGKIKEVEEIEAVACAVQNFLLTCTAYGLSAYWSSPAFIYTHKMNEFLQLNEADRCLGILYVGYPNEIPLHAHRKPLEYISKWYS
jgi:nitroreductase